MDLNSVGKKDKRRIIIPIRLDFRYAVTIGSFTPRKPNHLWLANLNSTSKILSLPRHDKEKETRE
jgi:hypothetical protein